LHDSRQNKLNTSGGTGNRSGLMLDLWDHGPLLMVIAGQFVEVADFSMSIEQDSQAVVQSSSFVEDTGQQVTARRISVSIETRSQFTHSHKVNSGTIRLYSRKHEMLFEDAIISQWETDGDSMCIEFVATDYEAAGNWYERFAE